MRVTRKKKQKKTKNKCLGYQEEDVGTRRTKTAWEEVDELRNKEKVQIAFCLIKNRNTSDIFHKPNIDAAVWGPFSDNYSFYPSFSSPDTKYRFFILLSSH